MTFKEFMLRKVPDDAAPDVAHRLFQAYLVEYYGSAIKAEFEQNKDNDLWVCGGRRCPLPLAAVRPCVSEDVGVQDAGACLPDEAWE